MVKSSAIHRPDRRRELRNHNNSSLVLRQWATRFPRTREMRRRASAIECCVESRSRGHCIINRWSRGGWRQPLSCRCRGEHKGEDYSDDRCSDACQALASDNPNGCGEQVLFVIHICMYHTEYTRSLFGPPRHLGEANSSAGTSQCLLCVHLLDRRHASERGTWHPILLERQILLLRWNSCSLICVGAHCCEGCRQWCRWTQLVLGSSLASSLSHLQGFTELENNADNSGRFSIDLCIGLNPASDFNHHPSEPCDSAVQSAFRMPSAIDVTLEEFSSRNIAPKALL